MKSFSRPPSRGKVRQKTTLLIEHAFIQEESGSRVLPLELADNEDFALEEVFVPPSLKLPQPELLRYVIWPTSSCVWWD